MNTNVYTFTLFARTDFSDRQLLSFFKSDFPLIRIGYGTHTLHIEISTVFATAQVIVMRARNIY